VQLLYIHMHIYFKIACHVIFVMSCQIALHTNYMHIYESIANNSHIDCGDDQVI